MMQPYGIKKLGNYFGVYTGSRPSRRRITKLLRRHERRSASRRWKSYGRLLFVKL